MAYTRAIGPAAIAALALLTMTGVPAAAADDPAWSTVAVDTNGLDLATPAGQATLHRRVERAARRVCGLFDTGTLSSSTTYRQCHDQAMADASAQLRTLIARRQDKTIVADTESHAP